MLLPPPLLQLGGSVFFRERVAFMEQQTHVFHELSKAAASYARSIHTSDQVLLAAGRGTSTTDPPSTYGPEDANTSSRVTFGKNTHEDTVTNPGTPLEQKPPFDGSKTRKSAPRKRNTLCAYELERKRNIERNNEKLAVLGLITAQTEPVVKKAKKPKKEHSPDASPLQKRTTCRSVKKRQYKEWSSDDDDYDICKLPPLVSTFNSHFVSP